MRPDSHVSSITLCDHKLSTFRNSTNNRNIIQNKTQILVIGKLIIDPCATKKMFARGWEPVKNVSSPLNWSRIHIKIASIGVYHGTAKSTSSTSSNYETI